MKENRPTVEKVYRELQERNFDDVKSFLVNREGYTLEEANHIQEEYIRYISLCAEYATVAKPIVISDKVDPFWHTHILFTRDYRDMCGRIFGDDKAYLNHEPTKTADDLIPLVDSYNNETLPLYEKHFGKPSDKFWPKNAMICGGSGCSCSGTGNEWPNLFLSKRSFLLFFFNLYL